MVVLGGGAVSYERGTPVPISPGAVLGVMHVLPPRPASGEHRKIRALTPLTPNTVELISTLGALSPEAGPSRSSTARRSPQPSEEGTTQMAVRTFD